MATEGKYYNSKLEGLETKEQEECLGGGLR